LIMSPRAESTTRKDERRGIRAVSTDIELRLRGAHRANVNAAETDSILLDFLTLTCAHKFAYHK